MQSRRILLTCLALLAIASAANAQNPLAQPNRASLLLAKSLAATDGARRPFGCHRDVRCPTVRPQRRKRPPTFRGQPDAKRRGVGLQTVVAGRNAAGAYRRRRSSHHPPPIHAGARFKIRSARPIVPHAGRRGIFAGPPAARQTHTSPKTAKLALSRPNRCGICSCSSRN